MAAANGEVVKNQDPVVATENGKELVNGEGAEEQTSEQIDHVFTVTLKLPDEPHETKIQISTQEQVQDVRQSIVDQPFGIQYSCFHLEHNGERVSDFIGLNEIPNLGPDSVFSVVEKPYSEKEARIHVTRVRELVGAAGEKSDVAIGLHAGASLHDAVIGATETESKDIQVDDLSEFDFDEPASVKILVPRDYPAPKTLKSITISPWTPPPAHLRNKGHLLYLVVVNLEGEQFHITSHVSGFYVNRSSHNKFDPSPKEPSRHAHSLLQLLQKVDSKFWPAFQQLSEHNSKREQLSLFSLTNALPANPWLVSSSHTSLSDHRADISRTQEGFLISGPDTDNLRDWNEEFQSTRELPVETVQEKVFRERLTSKLFADFNEAAVKGAILVARGEILPLNPTEGRDAQIFVHNNVFFSFGADGVGTFATEGGDEAARVATGKDVAGVKLVNQLDINGLFTAGSIIVDYSGRRIVGQSIVPGIFRHREPEENQIDYGGVEGKDIIAENEGFVKPFEQLSKSTYMKKHPVWDKEGKRHDLEASVDTKGLLGTDGRRYVLDLYRLTPLDVTWIKKHWGGSDEERSGDNKKDYPHRMAILRPELISAYRMTKLREHIDQQVEKASKDGRDKENGQIKAERTRSIAEGFEFTLNPDVFSGQTPQTDEEKEQLENDEALVRKVCEYLTSQVIPKVVQQLQDGEVGFPIDGESLTSLMHKRGINVRYLGTIAELADEEQPRLQALRSLAIQEMVARAFKHVASKYMRHLPPVFLNACVSHLMNCLLGGNLNDEPTVHVEESLKMLYDDDADTQFEQVTIAGLKSEIVEEIRKRYRFDIKNSIVQPGKELQMLREVALKLGLQMVGRDYAFSKDAVVQENDQANGTNVTSNGNKRKKKGKESSPSRLETKLSTFYPDDIVNFVPVVKDAAPKSILAEEAFEGGRISLAQDQKEIGQELLLESLTLHEQIYGILHPEVARMYLSLSNIYYSLDEKSAAAELARKAVVIAERTMGLDTSETILAYLNLALFEHGCGRSALGLKYILHAIDLSKIVYGPNHPDSITILNNGAVMLQSLRRYHESRIWFEASVTLSDTVSGKASPNTATLLFQLAQALALDKDHRAAVTRMRESCNLFRTLLGPDDRNTKEAETWLDQLTQNAVSVEKRAKDIASGKIKRVHFNVGAKPMPRPGQSRSDIGASSSTKLGDASAVDKRSIDDLLKFINGSDSKKKGSEKETISSPAGGKKKTNPKRRGGASVASKH